MSLIWQKWCRLCAKEDDYNVVLSKGDEGIEYTLRISKYLSIQISNHEFPDSICRECCETLAHFDIYAVKCEKIQSLFQSLIQTSEKFTEESCRTLKENYLQTVFLDEKKILPIICELKNEDEKTEIVNGDLYNLDKVIKPTRKRRVLEKSDSKIQSSEDSLIKNEISSDIDDVDFTLPGNSDSEDDYLPLANVTGKFKESNQQIDQLTPKVKKRKSDKRGLKNSSKSKRKKKDGKLKPKIPILDALVQELCDNIKDEPMSDGENINGDDSDLLSIEKKLKKEKKKNTLSFLKYDCYICGEDTRNWHALCVHFRDVHDSRAKVMCCCGKFLASRVSIGRHSAKHGKACDSYNCSKCNKRFPRESELASHMITHLPKEEYPFVCCKCARRFTTQQLLRHHEKKHIPMEERLMHPCEICQSKFASKSSLLMHMKAVHERLKPFVCDQCGRAFTTKGILEEHQVRHSDARPHVCPVCHKSFKTKQRLAIHSDTHNDTVYQCPHCPIQLNSRRTLRMHLFVHDEVCRYQCNFCTKAFKRAKDLKNHSNLHTGRRPYSCPWCSRTFANGSNCRAHKRRMHPNELRVSDASAAMVNKVTVSAIPEEEEKQSSEAGPPKVIYTTVKRKLPATSVTKSPNFTFRPDVTEKEHELSTEKKDSKENKDEPSLTKQEKNSPVHAYESSMSPLNLNTSSTIKFLKASIDSGLTITPIIQSDTSINDFQDVANNFHSIIPNRTMEQNFANDYKDGQDGMFAKSAQQLYANFGSNVVSNLYNAATSAAQFASSNPYALHFTRDDDN